MKSSSREAKKNNSNQRGFGVAPNFTYSAPHNVALQPLSINIISQLFNVVTHVN